MSQLTNWVRVQNGTNTESVGAAFTHNEGFFFKGQPKSGAEDAFTVIRFAYFKQMSPIMNTD